MASDSTIGAAQLNPPDAGEPIKEIISIPADKRPCFRCFGDWFEIAEHDGNLPPGVWYFGMTKPRKDELSIPYQTLVCSPLSIEAVTCDKSEDNFGRLLRFKNTRGQWREWAMPMELLSGAAEALHKEILSMGVVIYPKSKSQLAEYLVDKTPKRKVLCATQVGWLDGCFVLPDEVIGREGSDVIFQSVERSRDDHTRGGKLEEWKKGISARAIGNPFMTLSLSAAFAGPLLDKCNGEGGGIHYVGDSSTGKTTLLEAACSVWGGKNYKRSWRATANGMEGAAALFNDCLMAIDEVSQCDPKDVGAIVYALGNGVGKQRASRFGSARSITRWRCVVLSSGERSIATSMAEGGFRVKSGQGVRLMDVNVTREFGAFDNLHGFDNGAQFADAIKRVAELHHGHVGREFLKQLIADETDFGAEYEDYKRLPEFASTEGEGQDKRAVARFALMAMAGEIATDYGLTGWDKGDATAAAIVGLQAWRHTRTKGNAETNQILQQVQAFIEKHGDSRFSNFDGATDKQIRDRAGWWQDDGVEMFYLFTAEGMRESLKGFDFNRALDCLQTVGALPPPSPKGERAQVKRIFSRTVRVYPIRAEKL